MCNIFDSINNWACKIICWINSIQQKIYIYQKLLLELGISKKKKMFTCILYPYVDVVHFCNDKLSDHVNNHLAKTYQFWHVHNIFVLFRYHCTFLAIVRNFFPHLNNYKSFKSPMNIKLNKKKMLLSYYCFC